MFVLALLIISVKFLLVGNSVEKKCKNVVFRSFMLFLMLLIKTTVTVPVEDNSYNLDNLDKNVIFTEGFYLKYLPNAMKQEDDEDIDDLNQLENSQDASLLSIDENLIPNVDTKTITREAAELERKKQEEMGKRMLDTFDDELSFVDETQQEQSTESPGSKENKEILSYDTKQKKKQLRQRLKRNYKDIPFGPQVPHLAMVDIFGVTGEDEKDPLMNIYGLDSRYNRERDIEDMENIWSSVVYPSAFKKRDVWGYDKNGNPIYSKRDWINSKLNYNTTLTNFAKNQKIEVEYNFPSRSYVINGFLDDISTSGIKSLLDKYRYQLDNKDKKERKQKKLKRKGKEPEIIKKEINDYNKLFGSDKQVGWQIAHNLIETENAHELAKDLEGVQDLEGIMRVYDLNKPTKQRKDVERVFWEYYSNKDEKNNFDLYLSFPKFKNKKPLKTLLGWREVLFDQAIENIGKYDHRASKRFDLLIGSEEIRGIPPSRIIADMSSEAIRRPKTHHLVSNVFKGFKNYFFKRLEKKYRDYVADILLLRSEDSTYNEMMNLANKYEARQDWLSKFENPWLFIPQSILFSNKSILDESNNQLQIDEYEKELLSFEFDLVPTKDKDIFIEEHLKGDILFPNLNDSDEEKEALFRKIIRETAMQNENQEYKLPHRPRATKALPKANNYNPSNAIHKREKLINKKVIKQGRVIPTSDEKQAIKILEKNAKKQIESFSNKKQELTKIDQEFIQEKKDQDIKNKFNYNTDLKKNKLEPLNIDEEYIYKNEGRGPRKNPPPFSTNAVSILRRKQKTIFDDILKKTED